MQAFGIGFPELFLILVLTVIVVGPERLPEVAAEMARWIRRIRAYANAMAKDLNEAVGDFEKEVGASRDDWKEIASVVGGETRRLSNEFDKISVEMKQDANLDQAANTDVNPVDGVNALPAGSGENGAADPEALPLAERPDDEVDEVAVEVSEPEEPSEEKEAPWFAAGSSSRRRRSRDA